jgi:hypothetical protein
VSNLQQAVYGCIKAYNQDCGDNVARMDRLQEMGKWIEIVTEMEGK